MSNKVLEPQIEVGQKPVVKVKYDTSVESQVIVHCLVSPRAFPCNIRIWPTVYLVDCHSGEKCKLVHSENIALYPHWQALYPFCFAEFTLIFQALPKACTAFDLIEEIPESGGFKASNIKRNSRDIYRVVLK